MVGRPGAARHLHPHLRASIWCAIRGPASTWCWRIMSRSPSGISYVLENRLVMTPDFSAALRGVRECCRSTIIRSNWSRFCAALSPRGDGDPRSFCSLPGFTTAPTSSTASSPRRWASSWWKAATWWWSTTSVYMKTIHGLTRVDVIYRRVDDDFLDPLAFRAGFAARRARPDECLSRGQYRAGQRGRHRRRGR